MSLFDSIAKNLNLIAPSANSTTPFAPGTQPNVSQIATQLKDFKPTVSPLVQKVSSALQSFAPPLPGIKKSFDLSSSEPTSIRPPETTDKPIPNDVAKYKTGGDQVKVPFSNKVLQPLFSVDSQTAGFDNLLNSSVKSVAEFPEQAVNTLVDAWDSIFKGKEVMSQPDVPRVNTIVSNTQEAYKQALLQGYSDNQAKAVGVSHGVLQFVSDFGFLYPYAPEVAKTLIRELPQQFLEKVITSEIPAMEIRASLTGAEGATARANTFIQGLSNQERKELFATLQEAEKTGAPITTTQGSTPTKLGEFAGVKPKETPGFKRTAPDQQLPGYLQIDPRTGAIGDLRGEPVGFGETPEAPKPEEPITPTTEDVVKDPNALARELMDQQGVGLSKAIENYNFKLATIKPEDIIGGKLSADGGVKNKTVAYWEDKIKAGDKTPVVLVGKDIIDGMHHLQAYKNLGVKEIPALIGEKQTGGIAGRTGLKAVGLAPEPSAKVIKGVDSLLVSKLKAEVKGSKEGFRAGVQEGKQQIKDVLPATPAQLSESYLLTERMKTLARGARMGALSSRQDILATQQELVDIINKSNLDLNDKGKFLASVKNVQSKAQLMKVMPEIKERIIRLDETARKNDLLSKIKSELGDSLYTGKGDKRISKYSPSVTAKLKQFQDALSFVDPAGLKMKQLEMTENWIMQHPDDPMPDSVLESLDELQRTHLKLLSSSELEDQLQSIKDLKTQGQTYRRLQIEKTKRDREEVIAKINSSITGGKGMKPPSPVIESQKAGNIFKRAGDKASEFIKRNLIPDNFFDELDEKTGAGLYKGVAHQEFIPLVNNARDARIQGTMDSLKEAQSQIEKMGRQVKNLGTQVDFGNKIKMTRNEMLDVYISSHDPDKLESIIEGNKIPENIIKKIIASLTPEEKIFGDYLVQFYGDSYDGINQVFKEKHFFDMPKTETGRYVPMTKDMDYVGSEDVNLVRQNMEYVKASVGKGFTKARKGSLAPVKLDAMGNFLDYVARTEHYKAFELPTQEMNAVLKGIKDAVVQEKGIKYYQMLEDYIKDVASRGKYDQSYVAKQLLSLRGKTATGLIGLNLVTAVKHSLASLGGALTELSLKDFLSGSTKYVLDKKTWDAFWDKVPQFSERASTVTREFGEIAQTKNTLQKTLGKTSIGEKQLVLIRTMDKAIVRAEATSVYSKAKAQGATEEEAVAQAVSKLRRTQTGGAVEDLPALMRGGTFEKMMTLFMSEKNKYFNLLYAYSRAYQQGRVPLQALSRVLFYAWIFNGVAMEEARQGGKAQPKDLLEAAALGPFEDLLVMGSIIESVRTGYSYESSPVFSLFSDIVKSLTDLKNGKWVSALVSGAENFATIEGYAVNPVIRIGQGMVDLLQGKTNDWRRLIWSSASLGETKQSGTSYGKTGSNLKMPSLKMPSLKMSMPSLKMKL